MGYELAAEALRRGAEVVLVSGPTHIFPPRGAKFSRIQTAQEMDKEVKKNFARADIIIMAAAVSDFRFAESGAQKIKKERLKEEIRIAPTQDVAKELGKKKGGKVLVGFAAETEHILDNALKKIKEKNFDFIVANDVSREDIGFESDDNQVSIVFPGGKAIQTEKKSKLEISQIILDEIEGILGKKGR